MSDTGSHAPEPRPVASDIGAGDPEASAGSIPNLIAGLIETETWRNAATVLMGVLLIGLGYWSYTGVRTTLAETRVVSLQALLGTVVKGLDVWIGERMTEVQRVARDPQVVARAAHLAAEKRDPLAAVGLCTQAAAELSATVLSTLAIRDVAAFRIVDRNGLVLASKDTLRCGQRLRAGRFRQRLDLAFDGAPQFVRPHADAELAVAGPDGARRPVAWFLAPIRVGNGAPQAVLAMGVETDRDLENIFLAARPGRTAESYAFGDDGLMLTSSRFPEQLKMAGVLP
mgnify:CR=1 FL=1